jgi:carbohydrate-selective porin OprB
MVELYWSWTFFKRLLVTPDVQFYVQPAPAPSQRAAAVFSLRVTKPF